MYDIHNLAMTIEDRGLDAVRAGVRDDIPALVSEAREAGVSPVLVDLLTTADAPEVARFRAYLLVRRALEFTTAPTLLAA